jgi:hypothetical protein
LDTSKSILLACAIAASACNLAYADGPAVSAPNAKLDAGWGYFSGGTDAKFVAGSATLPLGEHFGFQADGLAGDVENHDFWALGGQGFWRDPDKGLVGLNGFHFSMGAFELDNVGAEGEVYLNDITLSAAAGRTFIKFFGVNLGHADSGYAAAAWYPHDDLQLSLNADFASGSQTGTIGAEFQPNSGIPGLALYGQAFADNQHSSGVILGLRVYFGPEKTLKGHHREDDPSGIAAINKLVSVVGAASDYENVLTLVALNQYYKLLSACSKVTGPDDVCDTLYQVLDDRGIPH